jgi:hypothetical protein
VVHGGETELNKERSCYWTDKRKHNWKNKIKKKEWRNAKCLAMG